MPVNFTESQEKAADERGRNLLVSAAAGSGKTAVLVERIVRMVTDPKDPVDIDSLLVMTFTNAAAAEMRERIGAAIEEKLKEEPGNDHLMMQSSLIHYAKIQTIDSFCLDLIRSYFDRLDRDPGFRVGDEGELLLLRQDVLKEVIEESYEKADPEFIRFVEAFASGKTDKQLEGLIEKVYDFSQSNPYPILWFKQCREGTENGNDLPPWIDFIFDDIKTQAEELALQISAAVNISSEDEYLCVYVPALMDDLKELQALAGAKDLKSQCMILSDFDHTTLKAVRSKNVDPAKKAAVTNCREREKKAIKKLKELYVFDTPENMAAALKEASRSAGVLIDLAERFMERYSGKKKELNLVDFADLEHEALHVLIEEENGIPVIRDGSYVYTDAADELAEQFTEIMIDEYQDSNLVQETLVKALSAERFGRPDVFTVGDVKQSIYRFRLARPELFLEKYENYSYEGNEKGKKIELQQNFRSREPVLDAVNDTFKHIMTPGLGNIRYTAKTALNPGAEYEPDDAPGDAYTAELLLVDTGSEAMAALDEDAADLTAREIEASLIARKIKELTDPSSGLPIWDREQQRYRVADYHDIVILLRSTVGYMDTILDVLSDEDIPAYAESRTGYFNTPEVETILNLLSVTDNPIQDIPLASVMHSVIGGFTDEEMAELMSAYKRSTQKSYDEGIYAALKLAAGHDDELGSKASGFLKLLRKFREAAVYLPIHELITRIYEDTGFYDYVSAMPAGKTRRANLDMLLEKASDYEKSSYRGLFSFVRYMENLKKVNVDFGEASTKGENENTVRIMSIHKSKGLEFPVVILAGMGKKFNRQDRMAKILIDPDLGIAADYCDLEHRVRSSTLKKNAFKRKEELESLGEEERILYVAMTRAREKLIMTGTDKSLKKTEERYAKGQVPLTDGQIPYTLLSTASSYLDWILMSTGAGNTSIKVTEVPVEELAGEELEHQVRTMRSRAGLEEELEGYNGAGAQELKERLNKPYPYEAEITLPAKFSVSELKAAGQMTDDEESVKTQESSSPGGVSRGTAYHHALCLLPLGQLESEEDVRNALILLRDEKKLSEEDFLLIDARPIADFLRSDIGKRMSGAQREGRLYRERQFVMGLTAGELGLADSDELIVIQGIIDAYFIEDEGIVLIDYKTDRVADAGTLTERYAEQLDLYSKALEKNFGLPVKERIIYSMYLGEEIPV